MSKKYVFLLICISAGVLASCRPKRKNIDETKTNTITETISTEKSALSVKDVDISDIENGKTYQEIKYQVITYEGNLELQKSLDVLNSEMKKNAESFKEENKESVREFIKDTNMEDAMYSFTEDVDFLRNDDKYLSLTEFVYQNTMGAHGNYVRNGHTYNVQTGKKMELMDFVRDKEELRTFLKNWIVEHNQDGEFFPYAEDVVDDYMSGEYELQYNIDATDLYVVFQPYDIGPYAIGLVEVKVDSSLLKEKI